MLSIGDYLEGRYKILDVIGHGGTSTVYLAVNERTNRFWAVKELSFYDEFSYKSFWNELAVLRKIKHKNLPDIIDVIKKEQYIYLIMEYVKGSTLREVLMQEEKVEKQKAMQWIGELCDVFIFLHSQIPPIIYRDLKPSNIKVRENGHIVLIDFGSATEPTGEEAGEMMRFGTIGYAAPEQYQKGRRIDERTDIYCLGITMYQLCVHSHLTGETARKLESIAVKCTKKNPKERYRSCAEIKKDLLKCGKREKKIRYICLFVFFVSVIILSGYYVQQKKTASLYIQKLEIAESAMSLSDQCRYFKEAVLLKPDEGEAYEKLLACLTQDGVFQSEDQKMLMDCIYQKNGAKECFYYYKKSGKKSYAEFCYDVGIAYFFQSEGNRGKYMSISWFGKYLSVSFEGNEQEINQRKRARLYQKVGSYYERLVEDDTKIYGEDEEVDYRIFFEDLQELRDYTAGIEGMQENTFILFYQEILVQIMDHALDFYAAGVTKEEMLDELAFAEAEIENLDNDVQRDKLIEILQISRECVENIKK